MCLSEDMDTVIGIQRGAALWSSGDRNESNTASCWRTICPPQRLGMDESSHVFSSPMDPSCWLRMWAEDDPLTGNQEPLLHSSGPISGFSPRRVIYAQFTAETKPQRRTWTLRSTGVRQELSSTLTRSRNAWSPLQEVAAGPGSWP